MSNIKNDVEQILAKLPEDANWDDFMIELYRAKKITYGLTDIEVVQDELSTPEIKAIIARLKSSSHMHDLRRNTKTYKPGNATTVGMVAGVTAVAFSLVFPPISWVSAVVAAISGAIGLKNKEQKAWIPILLAAVSIVPMISILN
jgi:hypothetical protein